MQKYLICIYKTVFLEEFLNLPALNTKIVITI